MKNIMYFRLKQGEEAAPLRDMALKYFPNVNLQETYVEADTYGENDVFRHIIRNINAGNFNKLYIKSLSDISDNAISALGIMDELKITNPDLEIEFSGGNIIKVHELITQINSDIENIMDKIERNTGDITVREGEYTDYLNVKIKSDGKKITVELPWDEAMIENDLQKAGIKLDNDSDVKFTVDTSLPDTFKKIIERACEEKGIYAANDISSAVLTYGMELDDEIMALIEYANADTTDKIMSIMYGADGITFIEGAKSLEDIGRYWVTSDMESSVEQEIDKYMDYESLGRDIMRDYEGKFVEGGCVLNRGEVDIEELFRKNENIEDGMGGMQGM